MNAYNQHLYPFKSQWLAIGENKVHYIDEGRGSVILFSHPPLGSSFMYRDFVKHLSKKYRCIALDYPGFGLSEPGLNYSPSLSNQCKVLEQFVEILNLKDITVLGHDTGGPSAFALAARRPNLFRSLILTDTIIYPVSEYPRISKMLTVVGSSFFQSFNAHSNFLVWATFRFGVRTRKLTKEERREYSRMFDTPSKRRFITQMLLSLKESEPLMQGVKEGFETVLNSKRILLMYGQEDPVKQMGIADRIHELLSNSQMTLIKGEGHFPHEGQAQQMSDAIDNWMGG